eukprot:TRINITY_DN24823_c0_g1_i1.p1 TRINITY_DN24823_c0_g1~~TRINITY_DN24823_c0_g1_i1.p1  ORF type:complete len:555 (+),score=210.59 TRINITY_DN24823_c0_g1_i1:175-1839(+)
MNEDDEYEVDVEELSDASLVDEELVDDDEVEDEDSGAMFEIESAINTRVSSSRTDESLTRQALLQRHKATVAQVVELLHISEGAARLLLRHFKWDRDRLQERFFEDCTVLCERTGIACYTDPIVYAGSETITCEICYDDYTGRSAAAIGACNHFICVDCYGQYLAHALSERGRDALCITCPARQCKWVCTLDLVIPVLEAAVLQKPFTDRNAKLVARYRELLDNSYVDDNPACQWCPAPGCDKAVHLTQAGLALIGKAGGASVPPDAAATQQASLFHSVKSIHNGGANDVRLKRPLIVTCLCGNVFCFVCGEAGHTPAKCYMVQSWLQKAKDESETVNWLMANTKPCPGCQTPIEKNEGCNHITCRSCGYNFCWVCEQEWQKHGSNWYTCNFYSQEEADSEEDKRNAARAELKRYIFYYTRYHNHDKSKRLERKILEQAERSMLQRTTTEKLHQVEYLSESANQLISARNTLKYSYIYAYHLRDGKEKSLFEYNQAQVEQSTESLSRMLEMKNKNKPDAPDRNEIINQQVLVRRSLERLQQGIFDSEASTAGKD